MAERPSPLPYAPGTISNERMPPRPARRAWVFLLATFVIMVVTTAVPWFVSSGLSMAPVLMRTTTVSGALILVWAYLSDRVAVWGTRREGYLLLTFLTLTITFLVLAVLGTHSASGLLAAVEFGLATSIVRAVVAGGLAEIGRRRAATGRLAAANIGISHLGSMAGLALSYAYVSYAFTSSPFLPMPVVAGIAAGLSLAVVVAIITLSQDGAGSRDPAADAPVTIPKFLRSRTFWSSAGFLGLAGLALVPREFFLARMPGSVFAAVAFPMRFIDQVATIVAAVGYMFLCRRASLRHILRISLFVDAVVLIAFERLLRTGDQGTLLRAVAILTVCDRLVVVAFFDLVLRAAPRGREAFGTILLGGFSVFPGLLVSAVAEPLRAPLVGVAWFAAAAAIVGALAVRLLPGTLVSTRDGDGAAPQTASG